MTTSTTAFQSSTTSARAKLSAALQSAKTELQEMLFGMVPFNRQGAQLYNTIKETSFAHESGMKDEARAILAGIQKAMSFTPVSDVNADTTYGELSRLSTRLSTVLNEM